MRGYLGRLVRTTAFKLATIYLIVFTAFALVLIGYTVYNTGRILSQQLHTVIEDEVRLLRRQYASGGLNRLIRVVEDRSRRPGASLYLVTDFAGNAITGNIAEIEATVFDDPDGRLRPVRYSRLDTRADKEHRALVRVFGLDGGFRILVGRDVGEREIFRGVVIGSLQIAFVAMLILGLITWWFVNRRVLKRIDAVADASRRIMSGDLAQRLPVSGTGDEFDRLSGSLNGMLDRIDELMAGLKEVSDNIAHDLKTPLSRLRNRVESALAGEQSAEHYRDALEATIEESDGLIKTFNALLLIARVEAGSQDAELADLDVAEVVRDAAELYEPVVEEAGARLVVDADQAVPARAHRELLAQAVVNLIDNALKYGKPDGDTAQTITVSAKSVADRVWIAVADNGPGIPVADRDRALGRFVRLEKSRSAPGSGLGLSLVAAVARLHGGTVRLEDAGPGLRAVLEWAGQGQGEPGHGGKGGGDAEQRPRR